ncbi:DUF2178 domain-containing protein [Methanofollis formosanus]|uniref:DUF2178 domain-containing protein n=1 Tax=Methanofollis formosanus TaxID=299308 RepID=A0A8G1A297_9EURY|nr:DUF2178 domain-containing protein [Methanofollis formosanus]QYZ78762.1 DUF2178 domain-containing protein [Methanofollis formosanus]
MNRSQFFLCITLIALVEVVVFALALSMGYDAFAELSFYIALLLVFVCRQRVKGVIWDERLSRVEEQVAEKTLKIALFLMIFFGLGFFVSGALLQLERPMNDGLFLLELAGGIILLYLVLWIIAIKPFWDEGDDE